MANKVDQVQAFCLHSRAYRDSSLIVEFFTQQHGRISAVAKGAKRPRSALRAVLQLFIPLTISWLGRGPLYTLTMAERSVQLPLLHGRAVLCGFYINELLIRLTRHEEIHQQLFNNYHDSIVSFAYNQEKYETILRRFELRLLQEIGYGLNLEATFDTGEKIIADNHYTYIPEHGAKIVLNEQDNNKISGQVLLALKNNQAMSNPLMKQAKYLLRSILAFYLGDKPLQSRALFQSLPSNAA